MPPFHNNYLLATSLVVTDTYLQGVAYDSTGRTREQTYGLGIFTKQFNYNPWNVNGGRLQSMAAGTLQNMAYTYDTIENILRPYKGAFSTTTT